MVSHSQSRAERDGTIKNLFNWGLVSSFNEHSHHHTRSFPTSHPISLCRIVGQRPVRVINDLMCAGVCKTIWSACACIHKGLMKYVLSPWKSHTNLLSRVLWRIFRSITKNPNSFTKSKSILASSDGDGSYATFIFIMADKSRTKVPYLSTRSSVQLTIMWGIHLTPGEQ